MLIGILTFDGVVSIKMRFDVVTLFPEMVVNAASYGVTGNAIENNLVGLSTWNPRDYTQDKHRTVDDRPYGGGPGMVMKYQPLSDAVNDAKQKNTKGKSKVVYLSPQGKQLTQNMLIEMNDFSQLILVAGRYEGIDERFIDSVCDEEWSLGDYVISGGELGVMADYYPFNEIEILHTQTEQKVFVSLYLQFNLGKKY